MRFYNPFSQSIKINQQHIPILNPRACQYKIVWIVTQRNNIILLILLEFKSLNGMLNIHCKQIDYEHFVI